MSYNINHAFLADKVYNDIDKGELKEGLVFTSSDKSEWTVEAVRSDTTTGYQGALFKNQTTGEYVFASRGTELTSLKDGINDLQMGVGKIPDQMASQRAFFEQVTATLAQKDVPASSLTLVGHSLGGALIQMLAAEHPANQAVTFNAYGPANLIPNSENNTYGNITNHVMRLDGISVAPGSAMIGKTLVYGPSTGLNASLNSLFPVQVLGPLGVLGDLLSHAIDGVGYHLMSNFLNRELAASEGTPATIQPSKFGNQLISMMEAIFEGYSKSVVSTGQFFYNLHVNLEKLFSLVPLNLSTGLGGNAALQSDITRLFSSSVTVGGPGSPLVLDLDGDGVETTSKSGLTYFDHDRNGFAERTGWAGSDDGLLVRDLNKNGQIDDGGELFGDNTLVNGKRAANGFEALKALDSNKDGVFSKTDTAWAEVKVWKDSNGNARVDSGELLSLEQAQVASIKLQYYGSSFTQDANNNQHYQQGSYTRTDGSTRSVNDVWFDVNRADSLDKTPVTIPSDVQSLLNLNGSGTLVGLQKAMVLDSTGNLKNYVSGLQTQLGKGMSASALYAETRTLLLKWAGVENKPIEQYNSQTDAREVAVLEKVLGESFQALLDKISYHSVRGEKIHQAFELLQADVSTAVLMQTTLKPVLDSIKINIDSTGSNFTFDVSAATQQLKTLASTQSTTDQMALFSFFKKAIGSTVESNTNVLIQAFDTAFKGDNTYGTLWSFSQALNFRTGTDADEWVSPLHTADHDRSNMLLMGGAGQDVVSGDNFNDVLDAGSGNDSLSGMDGNDLLIGGLGDDKIDVGAGTDILWYRKGDGRDVIAVSQGDGDGADTLKLLDIKSTAVSLSKVRNPENGFYRDLKMSFLNSPNDSITVDRFFDDDNNDYKPLGRIEFSDGVVWDTQAMRSKALLSTAEGDDLFGYAGDDQVRAGAGHDTVHGQGGNDALYGESGDDYLYGDAGNDFLYGGTGRDVLNGDDGNDVLAGEQGNDSLYGNNGDDVLRGGVGDDALYGGEGNNTYEYRKGDGRDIIYGESSTTNQTETLKLLDAVSSEVKFYKDGSDLLVGIASQASDLIRVMSHFDLYGTGQHFLDQIQFSDGTVWNAATINAKASAYVNTVTAKTGTDKADSLLGTAGADELQGQQGDDVLDGGTGDDVLKGGLGNDTYVFKVGAGRDVIDVLADGGQAVEEQETLRLQSIKSTEVALVRDGLDLLVRANNSPSDVVRVLNQFYSNDPSQAAIDQIVFSDNVTWNANTIQAKVNVGTAEQDDLIGYSGADTLNGGDGNDALSGQDGNDALYGDAGNDYIEGDEGNDNLYGGSGNDALFGGSGNDDLQGGAGNDKLNGDSGDNTLEGGLGDDELIGRSGNNTYILNRGDGRDTLEIQTYSDSTDYSNVLKLNNIASTEVRLVRVGLDDLKVLFKNNSGDEFLVRGHFYREGLSIDSIDQIVFSDGAWNALRIQTEVLKSSAEADTLVGYGVDDVLYGGAGGDSMNGNGGNDTLYGEAGDDRLLGGDGGDTLDGGFGNDVLYGEDGDDILRGGLGDDFMDAGAGNDVLEGSASDDNMFGGDGNDSLDGGEGIDTLRGGNGADTYLFGKGYGQDTINNGYGDFDAWGVNADSILFASGIKSSDVALRRISVDDLELSLKGTADTLTVKSFFNEAGVSTSDAVETVKFADGTVLTADAIKAQLLLGTTGNDGIYGYTSNDKITGGDGDDSVWARDGDDTVSGGNGNDTLGGDAGNDTLDGGTGADQLLGGTGNDTYVVDNTGDVITENANEGMDLVKSSIAYTLGSNLENLTLSGTAAINGTGNALNNVLTGNSAANTLTGGAGNDTLNGGAGNDTLDGGSGTDKLLGGAGNDVYVFGRGYGVDTITDADNTSGNTDIAKFQSGVAANQLWFRHVGSNLEVSIIGTTDKLTVQNWYSGAANQVEQFKTADNKTLLNSQVENLVSAMAAFAPPASGQTTLPANYQTSLNPVFAANWK